jgi:5-dehydro-2-deoxygluconokinase
MAGLSRLYGRNFLVLGRAGMDLYADPPGTEIEHATRFVSALGGSSANIAVALVRAGGNAALVTCVSDDAVGRFCLNALDAYGIDRSHVRIVGGEARNSLAVVETRMENTQSVIYRNGAADFAMSVEDVDAVDFPRFSALVLTGTVLSAEPSRTAAFRALDFARLHGLPVVFDLDYRPYSWPSGAVAAAVLARAAALCDIIVGNDVEFGILAGNHDDGLAAARGLVASGAAIVVYKMGERGAVTLTPQGQQTSGIFATDAIKPAGAGDAFLGNFLMGLANGLQPGPATLRGSAAAALVVARIGCAPAMPRPDELNAFIAASPTPQFEAAPFAHSPI